VLDKEKRIKEKEY